MFEISYLIINCFSTYIVLFSYSIILGRRKTRKLIYYLSYFGYFCITSLVYLIFNIPLYNILCNILIMFCITFNYIASIKKRLLVTLSFYVFVATIESIVVFTYQILIKIPQTGDASKIWGMAIAKIFTFILCGTILRKFDLKQNIKLSLRQTLNICVVTLGVLVLTYVLMTKYYTNMKLVLVSIITLYVICIFIFNFISMTLKSQIEEQQKKRLELQSESYLNELKILNKAQKEMRYLKHDMLNHLNTIQELAGKKDYSNIQTYIENLTGLLKSIEKISNTNIEELDSIINYKISIAKDFGIKVNSNIKIDKDIKIESHDYVSIIGNLFDNAIEAVSKIESNDKYIDFSIGIITSLLVINIENPYCHKVIIRDGKFLTTKDKEDKHGFGLSHVHTLVGKYDGTISISYDSNFIVKIALFNK